MLSNHTIAACSSSPYGIITSGSRQQIVTKSRRISEALKPPDPSQLDVPNNKTPSPGQCRKISTVPESFQITVPNLLHITKRTPSPNRRKKTSTGLSPGMSRNKISVTQNNKNLSPELERSRKISREVLLSMAPGEIDCPCLLHCQRVRSIVVADQERPQYIERIRKKSALLSKQSVGTQTDSVKTKGFKKHFRNPLKS